MACCDTAEQKIAAMLGEWEAGRATSPSPFDYVLGCDEAIRETDPGYQPRSGELMPLETVADETDEAIEDLHDVPEIAAFIVARLYGLDVEAARCDWNAVRETIDTLRTIPADQRDAAAERVNAGEPLRLSSAW